MGDVFYDMSKLSEMKNVDDVKEKKITKAEFKDAMDKVISEQMNDPDLKDKGMAALLLPMLIMTTIAKMERILFGEEIE